MADREKLTERRIQSGCALAVTEAERNGIMTRRDSNHHDQSRSNSQSKARPKREGSQSRADRNQAGRLAQNNSDIRIDTLTNRGLGLTAARGKRRASGFRKCWRTPVSALAEAAKI